jgi:hypothetical protein
MPASRTTFAFKVSEPLVPVQDNPVGGNGAAAVAPTLTVAL